MAEAWPRARLVTTTGQAHRGVLRDPGVMQEVVRFVSTRGGGAATGSWPPPPPATEAGRLEYQLFHRGAR